MGATSRDHVVFVVGTVVLAEGNLWPILVNHFRCANAHLETEAAMKNLAILSFILGVLVTAAPAQAQSRHRKLRFRPPVFNGLSFLINR
jgi:hypothetical protein